MTDAISDKPLRQTGFSLLMYHSPLSRLTRPDPETFKGLRTVEEVEAWMAGMYTVSSAEGAKPIQSVVLCGSARFLRQFHEWNAQLSTHGFLVWSLGINRAPDLGSLSPMTKATLEAVHFAKIAQADAVLVIDSPVDGKPYIGESTAREIAWAEKLGKPVFYAGKYPMVPEFTKPAPEPWSLYGNDQLEDNIRDVKRLLDGMFARCPAALLEHCSGIWDGEVHDEYGWADEIDVNAISEEPESFPAGCRHVVSFSAELGEAVLVIDQNGFDEDQGKQVVRWHLEPLTAEEKWQRQAPWREPMTYGDLGLPEPSLQQRQAEIDGDGK
jgi:hypothetical protein